MPRFRVRWNAPKLGGLRRTCFERVLRHQCPQCGRGPLFERWARVRERCDHCGLIYRREDGSELGAMYVSAVVSQVFAAALSVLLWVVTDLGVFSGLAVGTPLVLAFCYGTLPMSMALWIAVEYLTDVANQEWWARPR
jgi:uncharacterized protein (DUF983 family)